MKRLSAVMLSMLIATPAAWAQGKTEAPSSIDSVCKDFYGTISAQAQSILHDTKKNMDQKQSDLAAVFNQTVDTDWIGKFVLGRFWKVATPQEQKEYLALYKQYLTEIYVSKFNGDDIASFELKLTSMNKTKNGDIFTKTLIKRPGQPDVHVDYTMTENGKDCRVRDIVIENVSLLSSQRSEFQSLANRSGVAGVIAAIKRQLS
jgi:phospholipid transport system substrate-binding protein